MCRRSRSPKRIEIRQLPRRACCPVRYRWRCGGWHKVVRCGATKRNWLARLRQEARATVVNTRTTRVGCQRDFLGFCTQSAGCRRERYGGNRSRRRCGLRDGRVRSGARIGHRWGGWQRCRGQGVRGHRREFVVTRVTNGGTFRTRRSGLDMDTGLQVRVLAGTQFGKGSR